MKNPWTLLALLSAMPGAYLSFRRSLIRDLKDQMVDLRNPVGIGVGTVSFSYRLLARIFVGTKEQWLDLFDPSSELNRTSAKTDKRDGLRIFMWFVLTFVFLCLSWLRQEGLL